MFTRLGQCSGMTPGTPYASAMPRARVLAVVAVLGVGLYYIFAFTLIGVAGGILAACALLVLTGQLVVRLCQSVVAH